MRNVYVHLARKDREDRVFSKRRDKITGRRCISNSTRGSTTHDGDMLRRVHSRARARAPPRRTLFKTIYSKPTHQPESARILTPRIIRVLVSLKRFLAPPPRLSLPYPSPSFAIAPSPPLSLTNLSIPLCLSLSRCFLLSSPLSYLLLFQPTAVFPHAHAAADQ